MPDSVVLFVQTDGESRGEKAQAMRTLLDREKIPYKIEISSREPMTPVIKYKGQSFHGTVRIGTLVELWEVDNYLPAPNND